MDHWSRIFFTIIVCYVQFYFQIKSNTDIDDESFSIVIKYSIVV